MDTQVDVERPTNDEVFKQAASLAQKDLKIVRLFGVCLDGTCECGKGHRCRGPGKHPFGDDGWQHRATSDEDEIASWFEDERAVTPNIGVLLGTASGIIDVEADTPEGIAAMKKYGLDEVDTPAFQSGRSPHYLFLHEEGLPNQTVVKVKGIEVRLGNGGAAQTVFPPSMHANGHAREWLPGRSPEDCDFKPLPRAFREEIVRAVGGKGKGMAKAARDATAAGRVFREGEGRHDQLYGAAINLARALPSSSEEEVECIHQFVLGQNLKGCDPPYPEDEVRRWTDDAIAWVRRTREAGVPNLDRNDPNAERILAEQKTPWEKMGLKKNPDNPREYDPGSWALTVVHGDPVEYVLSGVQSPTAGEVSVTLTVDEFTSAAKTAKKILATSADVDPANPTPEAWQKLWIGQFDEDRRVPVTGLKIKLLDGCRHEHPPVEYLRYALLASWMLDYLRRFKKPSLEDAAPEASPTGQPKWIKEDGEVVLSLRLADAWNKAAEQAKGKITAAEWRGVDKRIREITGEKKFARSARRGQTNKKTVGLTLWSDSHISALERLAGAQH